MQVLRCALRLTPAVLLSALPLLSFAGVCHGLGSAYHLLPLYGQPQAPDATTSQSQAPDATAPAQPPPGKKAPANRKHLNVTVGPVRMHIPVSGKRPLPAATGANAGAANGNTGASPEPGYPITGINILLPASPDANTANWGTPSSTFAIGVTAGPANGRVNPDVSEDVFLVIIKQDGKTVCGARTSLGRMPASSTPVSRTWSGAEAAALLGKNCTLPPGEYELSAQFAGDKGGTLVALSALVTRPFTIKGNDPQAVTVVNNGAPSNPPDYMAAVINAHIEGIEQGNKGTASEPGYPISAINITLPANPDATTANWGTSSSPFSIGVTAGPANGRVNPDVSEDIFLVIVKQNGKTVCGGRTSLGRMPASSTPVSRTWSGAEAAALLGKNCTLPPGDYELSAQIAGDKGGTLVALSAPASKPFSIGGNDRRAVQPPQGIYPADGTTGVIVVTTKKGSPAAADTGSPTLKQNPGYVVAGESPNVGNPSAKDATQANTTPQPRSASNNGGWATNQGTAGDLTTVMPQQAKPLKPLVNLEEQPIGAGPDEPALPKGAQTDTRSLPAPGSGTGKPQPADGVISAINITLPTNPDANTANWGTSSSTFVIGATAGPANGRVNPILEEGKILVIIKQNGKAVCGARTSIGTLPASSIPVSRVWSGSNAAALLGKSCTLLPGEYELSVQFAGNKGGALVAMSAEKTIPFAIRIKGTNTGASPSATALDGGKLKQNPGYVVAGESPNVGNPSATDVAQDNTTPQHRSASNNGGWATNQSDAAVGTVMPRQVKPLRPLVNTDEQPLGPGANEPALQKGTQPQTNTRPLPPPAPGISAITISIEPASSSLNETAVRPPANSGAANKTDNPPSSPGPATISLEPANTVLNETAVRPLANSGAAKKTDNPPVRATGTAKPGAGQSATDANAKPVRQTEAAPPPKTKTAPKVQLQPTPKDKDKKPKQ